MSRNLNFNGINGATGEYLFDPIASDVIARIARGEKFDPDEIKELQAKHERSQRGVLALSEGLDPKKLEEAGWGIIFAATKDKAELKKQEAIQEALGELLTLRSDQATKNDERFYQVFSRNRGYRRGESKQAFLERLGIGPGPANPARGVPYYLLLVGSPDEIPYSFQYQLDVQYAVGRLHFDTLDEYAQYARSVATAEGGLALPRRAVFFGVRNQDDIATTFSADKLVTKLAERFTADPKDWTIESQIGEGQTEKARLSELLGGARTPAVLFTASHGMGFPNGDDRQLLHQGALLCQDWPGKEEWHAPIPENFYFSGDDIGDDARVLGLVAFHFACYSVGTPALDAFAQQAFQERKPIAPNSFLASMPRRLLGHPKGGALAVIGHIERAWDYSFQWKGAGEQLETFESSLKRLFNGHPIGSAFEYFNERYAELSSDLSAELEEISFGNQTIDDETLAGMWTANNDARNYIILGDPAVRAPVGAAHTAADERGVIETVAHRSDEGFGSAHTDKEGAPKKKGTSKKATTKTTSRQRKKAADPPEQGAPPSNLASATVTLNIRVSRAGGSSFAPQEFGIKEDVERLSNDLLKTLQQFTTQVGTALEAAVKDVSELKVTTYVNEELSNLTFDELKSNNPFEKATPKIQTLVKIDGDTEILVPARLSGQDRAVLELHAEMVERAQANRAEMLKMAFSALAGLINVVKGA